MGHIKKTRHRVVVTGVYVSLTVTLFVMATFFLAKGDYLNLLKLLLLSLVFVSPKIVEWMWGVTLTQAMEVCAVVFIFGACILGEVYDFYTKYPLWDNVLHFGSGLLFCAFACALVREKGQTAFAFCFSVTTSTLWEFFEFFVDMAFHTNMQKDTLIGEQLDIGLVDTMTDLIAGAIGAAFFVLWLSVKEERIRASARCLIPVKNK